MGGEQHWLEIYLRPGQKVDNIRYGEPDNERIQFGVLKCAYRMPMDIYPDPRIQIEDAHDKQAFEDMQSKAAAAKEEERLRKEAADALRRQE